MTANNLSEDQMVTVLRNALIVAGQEMGEGGDHWPVIKSTVVSLAQDWENLKIERAVDDEMKIHLYKLLDQMEKELPHCTPEAREQVIPLLKELREIYDAYFSETPASSLYVDPNDVPEHIKRAKVIVSTLEDDDNE